MRREEFIGMRTDGVEVTVAADDRERKGGKQRRRKREGEKEKGRGVVLQRMPVAFQTGLTPCPSGSLVGVLSRWQSRHRATSPFSHPFHRLFFHSLASFTRCTRKHFSSLATTASFLLSATYQVSCNFWLRRNASTSVNKMSMNHERWKCIVSVGLCRNRKIALRDNDSHEATIQANRVFNQHENSKKCTVRKYVLMKMKLLLKRTTVY